MNKKVRRLWGPLTLALFAPNCSGHLREFTAKVQTTGPMGEVVDAPSLMNDPSEGLFVSPNDPSDLEGIRLEKVIKADVVRLLVDHGFPKESVPKMVCTARFESNFSAFASNRNRNGTMDTGLFQINDIWLKACNVSREDLLDPEENTRCAYTVFRKQGYRAWVAYKRKRSICQKYKLEPSLTALLQGMALNPKRS